MRPMRGCSAFQVSPSLKAQTRMTLSPILSAVSKTSATCAPLAASFLGFQITDQVVPSLLHCMYP